MIMRLCSAAVAATLAFAASSFAADPAATAGSTSEPKAPAVTAALCERLSGAQKEHCMRQALQGQGRGDSATGATSGSGAGTAPSSGRPGEPAAGTKY